MVRIIPCNFKRLGVFMFGGIGNYIMLTPFLKAIRDKSKNNYILLLVAENSFKDVALEDGFVDAVLNISDQGILSFFQKLREEKLDTTITTTGINSLKGSILAFISGAQNRIGEDQNGFGLLYSHKLQYSYNDHEVEGNIKLLAPLQITTQKPILHYNLSVDHSSKIDSIFSHNNLARSQTIIAMHPGSGERLRFKRWPAKNFALTAKILTRKYNAKIILLGGQGEQAITDSIASDLDKGSFLNLTGELTLKESGALLKRCTMLITNDTSIMHIGSALKVPLIALFGPTMAHKTGPYTKSFFKIITSGLPCSPCYDYKAYECQDNFACMKKISVSDVICEVKAFLKGLQ